MNKEQEELFIRLQAVSDVVAGTILKEAHPADIFPEQVDLTSTKDCKIVNVNMTWSFQSRDLDSKPQLVVQSINIGSTHTHNHGHGWKEY